MLVEDLHWADSTTLDLVEHLLSRPPDVPLLATYRLEDPATTATTADWLTRVRRQPSVATLELGPLTRDESAELLDLIGAVTSADDVDRIHQRSAGVPLFVEQLAAQAPEEDTLPGRLADLLDRDWPASPGTSGPSSARWAWETGHSPPPS